ncbi:MAG: hypothetical protein GY768_26345, partial [Planctomycetaceae bacterium]|nr:hypothetical protein [Planctomycetaceae bacterium]
SKMPSTIYDRKYKNIPRPPVDRPIYATQGILYHQENDLAEMKDDPQRFDLMSVTRIDRKLPDSRKNWNATQLKDFADFEEWQNGYSGSSQWNLCRKMEPSRLQRWLREVHVPEVGFAGYEHNMYRGICGFRLVQVTEFVNINHEDDYGNFINSRAVTYYAEGANKPPRDRRHHHGCKEMLTAAFYAWFPEEFDAVNRAQGILPPYDRWTVEDLCVFQADRRDAYASGDQKFEESMQPYSQGWYKLA